MTNRSGVGEFMPAAVVRGVGKLSVEELPVPSLGPADVLVEVGHCGVCGTDLHFVLEGWAPPGTVPGHETSGVVAAVGSEVSGWSVGDEVVVGPTATCGVCAMCIAGRPSLCERSDTPGVDPYQGAFAQYQRVAASQLLRLPRGLSARDAALCEPLAVALHALTVSAIGATGSAMVFGAGPIGALIVAALVAAGHDEVSVVEPSPVRQAHASALGATRVLAPDVLEVPSIAEPHRILGGAVDVVYECSGRRAAQEAGLAQLRRGGTLVLVGSGIDPPRFDPNRIVLNELVITGSYTYDEEGFEDALTLLASGTLPTDILIDANDVPLSGALEAIQQLGRGAIAGKVLISPGAKYG